MRDCPHGNSIPDDVVSHLPPSQAGGGRHKCAVCSYAQGRGYSRGSAGLEECTHGSGAPVDVLASLPDYQGQPTRHMCATCAFAEGQANESRDTPETAASPPEVADAQVTLEERAGRQSGQRYQESVEVRQAIERRAMRWLGSASRRMVGASRTYLRGNHMTFTVSATRRSCTSK